jgi:hypothetical protein
MKLFSNVNSLMNASKLFSNVNSLMNASKLFLFLFLLSLPTVRANIITSRINNCTLANQCNGNGVCLNRFQCQCYDTYYTTYSGSQCSYQQKLQHTAFLLQVFLGPIGAGHFYVGMIGWAMGELILTLIPLTVYVICKYTLKMSGDGLNYILAIVTIPTYLAGLGWWIANVVNFRYNNYNDGNGVPLAGW